MIRISTQPFLPSQQLLGSRTPQAIRELDARMRAPEMAAVRRRRGAATAEEHRGGGQLSALAGMAQPALTQYHRAACSPHPLAPRPSTSTRPAAILRQDQLITNVNARVSPKLSFTGSYTLNKASSDTDGAGTFAADPYNLRPEYGRAGFDIRHRVQFNGVVSAPWGIRLSPFLVATSGRPFNITVGRDLNGDTLFTDRPAFATDLSRASVRQTAFGAFDLAPARRTDPDSAQLRRRARPGRGESPRGEGFQTGQEVKGKRDPMELTVTAVSRNLLQPSEPGAAGGQPEFAAVRRIDRSGLRWRRQQRQRQSPHRTADQTRFLRVESGNGRGGRIRTFDLLVPNQTALDNSLITQQIFLCKTSKEAPKIRLWVGNWVGGFHQL